jgi:hypothetical protein
MCDHCDRQLSKILDDPARRDGFLHDYTGHAIAVAGAIVQLVPQVTNHLELGGHQGATVFLAAIEALAKQLRAGAVEGRALELADLLRAGLDRVPFVQRLPVELMPNGGKGLATAAGVLAPRPAADPEPAPNQAPAKA